MWFRCEVFKGRRLFLLISLQRDVFTFFFGLPVQQPLGFQGLGNRAGGESKISLSELNFEREGVNIFGKDVKSPCSLSIPLCKSL